MYLHLKDLQEYHVTYEWYTFYVGIEENYFRKEILTEFAIELMQKGDNSELISALAWGIDEEDFAETMARIKRRHVQFLKKKTGSWEIEFRKLRYVYLKKAEKECTSENELLDAIAQFYDNFGYPEDMSGFINYMPQDLPTSSTDLLNRFKCFLEFERKYLNL
jgi:hypothetical protein